jgi:hypothetical protein
VKTGTDITLEKPNRYWFNDQWLKIFGKKINASNKMNSFILNMPYLNFRTDAKYCFMFPFKATKETKG